MVSRGNRGLVQCARWWYIMSSASINHYTPGLLSRNRIITLNFRSACQFVRPFLHVLKCDNFADVELLVACRLNYAKKYNYKQIS